MFRSNKISILAPITAGFLLTAQLAQADEYKSLQFPANNVDCSTGINYSMSPSEQSLKKEQCEPFEAAKLQGVSNLNSVQAAITKEICDADNAQIQSNFEDWKKNNKVRVDALRKVHGISPEQYRDICANPNTRFASVTRFGVAPKVAHITPPAPKAPPVAAPPQKPQVCLTDKLFSYQPTLKEVMGANIFSMGEITQTKPLASQLNYLMSETSDEILRKTMENPKLRGIDFKSFEKGDQISLSKLTGSKWIQVPNVSFILQNRNEIGDNTETQLKELFADNKCETYLITAVSPQKATEQVVNPQEKSIDGKAKIFYVVNDPNRFPAKYNLETGEIVQADMLSSQKQAADPFVYGALSANMTPQELAFDVLVAAYRTRIGGTHNGSNHNYVQSIVKHVPNSGSGMDLVLSDKVNLDELISEKSCLKNTSSACFKLDSVQFMEAALDLSLRETLARNEIEISRVENGFNTNSKNFGKDDTFSTTLDNSFFAAIILPWNTLTQSNKDYTRANHSATVEGNKLSITLSCKPQGSSARLYTQCIRAETDKVINSVYGGIKQ